MRMKNSYFIQPLWSSALSLSHLTPCFLQYFSQSHHLPFVYLCIITPPQCLHRSVQDLNESRALCMLALIGPGLLVGSPPPILACADCLTFASAYTIPLTNPTPIAETDGIVTGASKKMRPLSAIGNLLSAPTMEYVVDEVTRTHQAEV